MCTYIDCNSCYCLRSIDLPSATELYCNKNSFLESISPLPCIDVLDCSECPSLRFLPQSNSLKKLDCSDCDSVICKGEFPNLLPDHTYQCPWLYLNKDEYTDNITILRNLQIRLLALPWLKSKQFSQWFYAPNNIGGRAHKQNLYKILKVQLSL